MTAKSLPLSSAPIMSNTNPDGRRYSLRLANEGSSQSYDPFAGNDLSGLLSSNATQGSPNNEDNINITAENQQQHQTPVQNSNSSLFSSGNDDDLLSLRSESQYHYNGGTPTNQVPSNVPNQNQTGMNSL